MTTATRGQDSKVRRRRGALKRRITHMKRYAALVQQAADGGVDRENRAWLRSWNFSTARQMEEHFKDKHAKAAHDVATLYMCFPQHPMSPLNPYTAKREPF